MITGRPTEYDPGYCAMLIEHMRQGLSYQAFAGVVGVSIQTLYNWEKANPDFLDAKKVGEAACLLYWETVGNEGLHAQSFKDADGMTVSKSINSAIWIFNMKNRHRWRDKTEEEARDLAGTRPLKDLSDDELTEKLKDDE